MQISPSVRAVQVPDEKPMHPGGTNIYLVGKGQAPTAPHLLGQIVRFALQSCRICLCIVRHELAVHQQQRLRRHGRKGTLVAARLHGRGIEGSQHSERHAAAHLHVDAAAMLLAVQRHGRSVKPAHIVAAIGAVLVVVAAFAVSYVLLVFVADTWWHAKTALDALPIEWDHRGNGNVTSASLLEMHRANLKDPGTVRTDVGNVDAAMGRAVKVVEATYMVPYVAHAQMEPGCATAIVTADRTNTTATGSRVRADRCRWCSPIRSNPRAL